MVTPDGRWRVEQIRVQRGGRTLTRLRVSSFGTFVGEVADVAALAALGVPLAALVEARRERHELVFDGPPGPDGGQFVDVETDDGRSVRVGEWIERPDGS